MHEIERIAAEPILHVSKSKRIKTESLETATPPSGIAQSIQENSTVLSSADSQAKDMITRRAVHLQATYIAVDSEPTSKARMALETVQILVTRLDDIAAGLETDDEVILKVLDSVVNLFVDELNPLSSFELLKSGLVEGLLKFATQVGPNRRESLCDSRCRNADDILAANVTHCQELLAKSLMPTSGTPSIAFTVLVKRLQESLSRMEEFEVILAAQNANEGRFKYFKCTRDGILTFHV